MLGKVYKRAGRCQEAMATMPVFVELEIASDPGDRTSVPVGLNEFWAAWWPALRDEVLSLNAGSNSTASNCVVKFALTQA